MAAQKLFGHGVPLPKPLPIFNILPHLVPMFHVADASGMLCFGVTIIYAHALGKSLSRLLHASWPAVTELSRRHNNIMLFFHYTIKS